MIQHGQDIIFQSRIFNHAGNSPCTDQQHGYHRHLASASFADTILAVGVSSIWGAAMVNAGSTVLDHLPHGSFFHATGGVCDLTFRDRLKLIPYETLIGAVLTLFSIIMYWICR